MFRRTSLLLLLTLAGFAVGCGGVPKGSNEDLDRPKPTPPTTKW